MSRCALHACEYTLRLQSRRPAWMLPAAYHHCHHHRILFRRTVLIKLKYLQTWELPHVPRPTEPIRLAQFKTLIDIEQAPFNADTFSLEDETAPSFDEAGVRVTRAPVLNRLRWRFTEEEDAATGALKRESNARLVRWDDGSLSLFLGGECVDVAEADVTGRQALLGVYHEGDNAVQVRSRMSCSCSMILCGVEVSKRIWCFCFDSTLQVRQHRQTSGKLRNFLQVLWLLSSQRKLARPCVQAQGLVASRLTFRPPAVESALHAHAARAAATAAAPAPGATIMQSARLQDFGSEHAQAVRGDQETMKLKCASTTHCTLTQQLLSE
jgi:Leo1-like protein